MCENKMVYAIPQFIMSRLIENILRLHINISRDKDRKYENITSTYISVK